MTEGFRVFARAKGFMWSVGKPSKAVNRKVMWPGSLIYNDLSNCRAGTDSSKRERKPRKRLVRVV